MRYMIWVLACSTVTFFTYAFDKKKAVNNRWRIPERTLLILAAAGGAPGAYAAMRMFRHKTRKPLFSFTIPVLALLQSCIFLYYLSEQGFHII